MRIFTELRLLMLEPAARVGFPLAPLPRSEEKEFGGMHLRLK